jgi:serine/threonine protein kinase
MTGEMEMDLDKICVGCFSERGPGAICQHCGYDDSFVPEAEVYLVPRTVLENKYVIGRILGQGGFGITYLAWDLNLNIKLAIKEYFPRELASRSSGHSQVNAYSGNLGSQYHYGLDKFLQEARTLAQFEGHPNIVSVRDYFQANNTAYLVMKYVEGITLKEHLGRSGGRLPVEQAIKIIMPIMDALIEVHSVNILHRDISPDNIFINEKGQVILIDFGAARQAISDKGHSMSIILKPGYAPEEQYRSKGNQGPWTDIYALAATLYHLITGRQPPESLDRLTEDQLVPPNRLGVGLKTEEEESILKALAVRARDRYQRMEDFQEALMGQMLTQSVKTTTVEPVHETAAPISEGKKSRTPIIIAGTTLLVAIIIALVVLLSGSSEEEQALTDSIETEVIVENGNTEEAVQENNELTEFPDKSPRSGFEEPTNYIASLEADALELLFYEWGYDPPDDSDYDDMDYRNTFYAEETRFVWWDLYLAHQPGDKNRSALFNHKYYNPDDTLLDSYGSYFDIPAGWTDTWISMGHGSDDPGYWEKGEYYVEILVDGIVIAAGSFEIK